MTMMIIIMSYLVHIARIRQRSNLFNERNPNWLLGEFFEFSPCAEGISNLSPSNAKIPLKNSCLKGAEIYSPHNHQHHHQRHLFNSILFSVKLFLFLCVIKTNDGDNAR